MAIIGTRGYPSYYGGFETAIRRLAPYLVDAGWDVTVYGRKGSVVEADHSARPEIHSKFTFGLNSKSLSTLSFGATASISTMLAKPDVALVMNVANGFFLPGLRARGIPTLMNVDGIEWDRAKWNRAAKAVFRAGAILSARWADELVFDARAIGDRWQKDFNTRGTFIPYGGDLHGELPTESGLDHRGYILLVARFVPENSVIQFFEAVPALADKWPVVIVGSDGFGGEFDAAARKLADAQSNVTWLGHVSDDVRLRSLWQHAGAYFHGHSVGGTNPALVQAMASGAPIVARDTVYNRETLGDGGMFVQATSDSVLDGIETMMQSSERETYVTSAMQRAGNYYSWDGVCEAYERSLCNLADQGANGARKFDSTRALSLRKRRYD
ncbi:glycosyltransferase [Curtobacterium sp. 'Ferrero']|uniref:glycosyltransferase n=1 Tax=Curtobacterium sp. 'Ferrero' TaxID=2033654 RepID=UPI001C3EFA9F|nr:glycosyltransferase [Curtobacterium sp. 'Ferrero']